MSYLSDKEEDEAFHSLSEEERRRYFAALKNNNDVSCALDTVLGSTWFDQDGDPKGNRNRPRFQD